MRGDGPQARVISRLRLDLVETRLRHSPTALDSVQSAEVATAAVSGVDALEATFARYVPQVVLAAVVPIAVLVLVASIDLVAAGVMLLTLPLVPVFMWLVGRDTEKRARDRWQALALLSNHFLDVVRGLPTLRAFNRGRAQVERVADVSEEYRRTTMGTLRIAFVSGAVLELAATLGIALVAVVVGVRLVDGRIEFEPALTILVLAPELYLPLRNLAAQFHASADGAAVAERMLDLSEAPAIRLARGGSPPDPAVSSIHFDYVSFSYPTRDAEVLRDLVLEIKPGGWSRSWERAVEGRARSSHSSSGSPNRRRAGSSSVALISPESTPSVGGDAWHSSRKRRRSSERPSPTTSGSETRRQTTTWYGQLPSWPVRTRSCLRYRAGTRRSWVMAAGSCRRGNDAGSRSRVRSCETRRSSSSTSQPPISIRKVRSMSSTPSSAFGSIGLCCLSRTGPSSRLAQIAWCGSSGV